MVGWQPRSSSPPASGPARRRPSTVGIRVTSHGVKPVAAAVVLPAAGNDSARSEALEQLQQGTATQKQRTPVEPQRLTGVRHDASSRGMTAHQLSRLFGRKDVGAMNVDVRGEVRLPGRL